MRAKGAGKAEPIEEGGARELVTVGQNSGAQCAPEFARGEPPSKDKVNVLGRDPNKVSGTDGVGIWGIAGERAQAADIGVGSGKGGVHSCNGGDGNGGDVAGQTTMEGQLRHMDNGDVATRQEIGSKGEGLIIERRRQGDVGSKSCGAKKQAREKTEVVALLGEEEESLGDLIAGLQNMLEHLGTSEGVSDVGVAKVHERRVVAAERIGAVRKEIGIRRGEDVWW